MSGFFDYTSNSFDGYGMNSSCSLPGLVYENNVSNIDNRIISIANYSIAHNAAAHTNQMPNNLSEMLRQGTFIEKFTLSQSCPDFYLEQKLEDFEKGREAEISGVKYTNGIEKPISNPSIKMTPPPMLQAQPAAAPVITFDTSVPIDGFERMNQLIDRSDMELLQIFNHLKILRAGAVSYYIPYFFELIGDCNNPFSRYLLSFLANKRRNVTIKALREIRIPHSMDNILHYYSKQNEPNLQMFVFEKLLPEVFNELRIERNLAGKIPLETLVSLNRYQVMILKYKMVPEFEVGLLNELIQTISQKITYQYLVRHPENRFFDFILLKLGKRALEILQGIRFARPFIQPLDAWLHGYGLRYFGNALHLAVVVQDKEFIQVIRTMAPVFFNDAKKEINDLNLTPADLSNELGFYSGFSLLQIIYPAASTTSSTSSKQRKEESPDKIKKKRKVGLNSELDKWRTFLNKDQKEIEKWLKKEKVFELFFNREKDQKYNLCLFENRDHNLTSKVLLNVNPNIFTTKNEDTLLFHKRLFKYLFSSDFEGIFYPRIQTDETVRTYLNDCDKFKFKILKKVYLVNDFDKFKKIFKKHKAEILELLKNPFYLESLLFNVKADDVLGHLYLEDSKQLEEIILAYTKSPNSSCTTLVHFGVVLKNINFLMLLSFMFPDFFKIYQQTENEIGLRPYLFAKAIEAPEGIIKFLSK